MADPVLTNIGNHTIRFVYTLTNADPNGAPIGPNHSDYADRSVQAAGTFGGGAVVVQGSNVDGSNWQGLSDPQGTAISLTSAGGVNISEVPQLTRPSLVGGAGSSVTVAITCRRIRSAEV
jgi:hypothetical protein